MRARVRIISLVASLLIAVAAHAQRVDRVALEDLTWTEVATALTLKNVPRFALKL